jgi:hypothetical protein
LNKVDMHTHTEHSPDSRTPLAAHGAAARAAGLDVVCVTDHNTIDGALRLREMADGLRVVVGEEINTLDGEIIGLFLERPIARGLSGEETIARIHEQGGIVSVPHPFSRNRRHRIRRASLDRLRSSVDCLEVLNARELLSGDNARAAAYASEHGLAAAAGSDAHRAAEVGRAYVEVADFSDGASFLAALHDGTVHGGLAGIGVHFLTRYDRLRKWWTARRAR